MCDNCYLPAYQQFRDPVHAELEQRKLDMANVTRFEEVVKAALQEVMKHAVAGHANTQGFNTFCNDPQHALDILRDAGITPMNTHIVENLLDTGIS